MRLTAATLLLLTACGPSADDMERRRSLARADEAVANSALFYAAQACRLGKADRCAEVPSKRAAFVRACVEAGSRASTCDAAAATAERGH